MSIYPPPSDDPRGIDPASSTVRTLAVVGVIFGTLGMSCMPFNLGEWITFGWPIEGSKTTVMDMWCFFSTLAGLGLSSVLLLSSFGCYHFKWWARGAILAWAYVSLAYGVLGIYFWGRFFLPWLRSEYAAMRGPDEVSGPIAWIIGTTLSVFVIVLMTRPAIRGVFEPDRRHPTPDEPPPP